MTKIIICLAVLLMGQQVYAKMSCKKAIAAAKSVHLSTDAESALRAVKEACGQVPKKELSGVCHLCTQHDKCWKRVGQWC